MVMTVPQGLLHQMQSPSAVQLVSRLWDSSMSVKDWACDEQLIEWALVADSWYNIYQEHVGFK